MLVAAGAMAISLIATGSAGAATLTIGSPLAGPFTSQTAGQVGTTAMVFGPNLASPTDGTIVNWRTLGFIGTFRVRAITIDSSLNATATASGPTVALNGGTNDQSLSVPVSKGQVIGFDNSAGSDRAMIRTLSPTYTFAGWTNLSDGGPPRPPASSSSIEFAYNATIRYCLVPKLVGKQIASAKQALIEADCSLGSVKKKKAKKGKKKPKGQKVVTSQSAPVGTSLGDQARVDVHVKVKPKKKKKK
jgi:hypothetical protein